MLRDADPNSFHAIYVVFGFNDLRYGIDHLSSIIEYRYHLKVFVPNTLFLFCGKRADRIKDLLWEEDGFLLLTKRVESGRFSWPRNSTEARALTPLQFSWLMQGFSIDSIIRDAAPPALRAACGFTAALPMKTVRRSSCSITRRPGVPSIRMKFLKDFPGTLVTDGYQVYHSLEKKRKGLKVAGCWVHAKLGSKERQNQRMIVVKPKVDDFFAWAKAEIIKLPHLVPTIECLPSKNHAYAF